jgi:hypothetical protein
MLPKRVGVPKMIASAAASHSVVARGMSAKGLPRLLRPRFRQSLIRHQFRNLQQPDLGFRKLGGPGRHRPRQPVYMAIRALEYDLNLLFHGCPLLA